MFTMCSNKMFACPRARVDMQGDQEKELDELEDAVRVGEEDEDEVDASDPDDELNEKKAEVEELECGLRFVNEDVKVPVETLQQYKSILKVLYPSCNGMHRVGVRFCIMPERAQPKRA